MTVWVALHLMMERSAAISISVETKTEEDIEAAIEEPEKASLGLSAEQLQLIIQVKSRSTAPWSVADFAAVLKGEALVNDEKRRRRRPLDLLLDEPKRRYIFVTNESLTRSLRSLESDSLIGFPQNGALPAAARTGLSAEQQAGLANRIAIFSGLTEELLDSKIKRLLSTHCHVPAKEHDACIRDLLDSVRSHMTGKLDGELTRNAVLNICTDHGGSVLPTRSMDHYVKPKSYGKILQTLEQRHAVIIAGPSGNGKTLTADFVEHSLRTSDQPFSVCYGELGPSSLHSDLMRADSVLFHLRDPWGSNRISPEAERWSSELPKLLAHANAGHKFLITSRSDVMSSAMHGLLNKLTSYSVAIEIEDYGPERLERIYDGIRSDLTGYPALLAKRYRSDALKSLSRPYEIDRFLAIVGQEDADKPRSVGELIRDSQIDAISNVVSEQVANWGKEGVTAATILWGVLKAREGISMEVLLRLTRRMRDAEPALRVDMDGLIEFLIAGRNLRSERGILSFYHPRVEDGLRLAVCRKRLDGELILSRLIDALVACDAVGSDWGAETAVGILRAAEGENDLEVVPSDKAREHLDAFLTQAFFGGERTNDSVRTLNELAEFGSPAHSLTQLAKILTSVGNKSQKEMFGHAWRPPEITDETVLRLQQEPRTTVFLQRFITYVLPFSRVRYGSRLGGLLKRLSTGLDGAYQHAIEIVAHPGGPNENIEAIIEAACSVDDPDYDWIIEQFEKADAEATAWFEKFAPEYRQAEEHEVDAAYADHLFDEPGDQFYNSQTGLKKIAAIRSKQQGVEWLREHPQRELLVGSLASVIEEQETPCGVEILRTLIELVGLPGKTSIWNAVRKHWDESLRGSLLEALISTGIGDGSLRESLLKTLFERLAEPMAALKHTLRNTSRPRRFELLVDMMSVSLLEDHQDSGRRPKRRHLTMELLSGFSASEKNLGEALVSALAGTSIRQAVHQLTDADKSLLKDLLGEAPTSTTQYLAALAVEVGVDASSAIEQLLKTGETIEGENAVLALGLRLNESSRAQLHKALQHPRYQVRQEALNRLLPAMAPVERSSILFLAEDRSADVRLSWAMGMAEYRWPEATPSLVDLLSDERNFNSDPGFTDSPSWSLYRVARAAANALGSYDELPTTAIDALLLTAKRENADPFVPCAALSALATKDDPRIATLLTERLGAPGLENSPKYRPIAQAAAWAIFDRAVAQKGIDYDFRVENATFDSNPVIAGPVLMALAVCADLELAHLFDKLRQRNFPFRVELLEAARAIILDVPSTGTQAVYLDLARLAAGRSLSDSQMEILRAWSLSLEPTRDVQRFTAWLAEKGCGLPVQENIGNPRDYELPRRIGFMSMRSLTPAREFKDREPDDGR